LVAIAPYGLRLSSERRWREVVAGRLRVDRRKEELGESCLEVRRGNGGGNRFVDEAA
jgi:hypothetical protein